MRTRNWPIRSKIIALIAVPVAALLALWIFATTLAVGPALSLLAAQRLLDELGRPGEQVVAELQKERHLSVVYLAGKGDVAALGAQRASTDRAVAELRRRANGDALRDAASETLGARVGEVLTALDALPAGRGFIDRRDMDRSGALGLYSSMITSLFRAFTELATLPDEGLNRQARALTALGQAREVLAQVDTLVAGATSANTFAEGEYGQLVQIIGTSRYLFTAAIAGLPAEDRTRYQRLTESESFVRLRGMEDDLIAKGRTGSAPPVTAQRWQSDYNAVQQQLRDFELSASDALVERTTPVAIDILLRLALAGVVGLAAVVVSLLIAVRIGRSLIRRLTSLRADALALAEQRLPDVVGRLRRGEEVDVSREAPPLEYGQDEIGQLGKAFSEVQRTAVRSAVDEAVLRRGLNEVFLNIARRSQTLLHRQLALLDKMERRATDPEELEDLFRVDHMSTRMRRHAEDLVILAGAAPGRGWRNPIPIVDVIRGAISEVENYARVDIQTVPPAAVLGRAVGDLIHLLAELIENATSFSPPQTRVQVVGQVVPNGYAIEIEDRGLGLTPEAIEDANRRLADPPDFDPANSSRLGLFVVAQLGARHGIRVRLRSSPYGGVTAVVLVPGNLVTDAPAQPARPARPATGGDAPTEPEGPGAATDGPSAPSTAPEPGRRAGRVTRLSAVPSRRSGRPSAAAPKLGGSRVEPPAGDDGLPRRVRQSSLAPQLREDAPAATEAPETAGPPAPRSPEQVRSLMAALQSGTARGRQDAGLPADRAADERSRPPAERRREPAGEEPPRPVVDGGDATVVMPRLPADPPVEPEPAVPGQSGGSERAAASEPGAPPPLPVRRPRSVPAPGPSAGPHPVGGAEKSGPVAGAPEFAGSGPGGTAPTADQPTAELPRVILEAAPVTGPGSTESGRDA